MTDLRFEPLDPGATPGLPSSIVALLEGRRRLPTSTARPPDLEALRPRAGRAWSDRAWHEELLALHRRLGAESSSLDSLEALAAGAASVVTGQQPGLLLGPLYTYYKILGAIALAEALTEKTGSRVVPVYWCGGDDSDFEEIRRAWLWRRGEGPYRAELPVESWEPGRRVGSIDAPALADLEEEAIAALAAGPGRDRLVEIVRSSRELPSLGERAAAWALRLFEGSGLVVVDARSSALRALGSGLFADYRAAHRDITTALRARSRELSAEGWPTPLDDRALSSGLFRVDGDVRRKLEPEELDTFGASSPEAAGLAPSVLLRPVWQDALLAPVAAVLGPSELLYHAQLAPLYERLGVQAAAPLPRPHVTLWPAGTPWIEPRGEHRDWLAGGARSARALAAAHLPEEWSRPLDRSRKAAREELDALRSLVDDRDADRWIRRVDDRLGEEIEDVRRRLGRIAAERAGLAPEIAGRWLSVDGKPQERLYCAPLVQWWFGERSAEVRSGLSRHYVEAIDRGLSPTWALRGGGPW